MTQRELGVKDSSGVITHRKEEMNIGCVSLVRVDNLIVSVKCAKGRGNILPGGKIEPGETFKQCAARELFEETGLVATKQKLIFQAPSGSDEFYVMCFKTSIKAWLPKDSSEGVVELVTWDYLLQSRFKAYYELLKDLSDA